MMCSACAGAIQSVQLTDCRTAVVTGYIQVPVYAASNATILLSHINGTVGSPCGGVFGASQASQTVQIRQGPASILTYLLCVFDSMQGHHILNSGRPACAKCAAPHTLIAMQGSDLT